MSSHNFDRYISFLKLLALTFPAIVIYIQIKAPKVRKMEGKERDKDIKPLKRAILVSEASLVLLVIAALMMIYNVMRVDPGSLKSSLDIAIPYFMIGGYSLWMLSIVYNIWNEREWLT